MRVAFNEKQDFCLIGIAGSWKSFTLPIPKYCKYVLLYIKAFIYSHFCQLIYFTESEHSCILIPSTLSTPPTNKLDQIYLRWVQSFKFTINKPTVPEEAFMYKKHTEVCSGTMGYTN